MLIISQKELKIKGIYANDTTALERLHNGSLTHTTKYQIIKKKRGGRKGGRDHKENGHTNEVKGGQTTAGNAVRCGRCKTMPKPQPGARNRTFERARARPQS